jgi:acyl-CoA thioesterase-1
MKTNNSSPISPKKIITHGCRWALFILAVGWAGTVFAAKIACVGDSITWGWSVGGPTSPTAYPALLQNLVGSQHTVNNYGYSGATMLKQGDVPYWNQTVYTSSTAWNPDVVVIMLGSNDAKSQNWQYNTNFASDYAAMIAHYRALGAKVYVMTPPPVYNSGNYGITPAVVNGQVVPLVRQIALQQQRPID